MSTHAIHIDTDTASDTEQGQGVQDFDSDSDGGMQLDPPEPVFQLGGEIEFDARVTGETRDDSDLTTLAPNPNNHLSSARPTPGEDKPPPPRTRTRMREEEHAALVVLNDWELLVTYALNSRRTIPQTRRLFTAKLLAPDDPTAAEELYAARFAVPASKSELVSGLGWVGGSRSGGGGGRRSQPEIATGMGNATAFLVDGAWREVVSHDDGGWWGIEDAAGGSHAGGGGPVRPVSGSGSGSGSGEGSRGASREGSRSV